MRGMTVIYRNTEIRAYWRECDHCGWTDRSTKPGRPDTNTSFSTPDIQRETGLTQSSITNVIHRNLEPKCIFPLTNTLVACYRKFFLHSYLTR